MIVRSNGTANSFSGVSVICQMMFCHGYAIQNYNSRSAIELTRDRCYAGKQVARNGEFV